MGGHGRVDHAGSGRSLRSGVGHGVRLRNGGGKKSPFAVSDAFTRIQSCIYITLKLQPVSGRFQGDPCCIATLRSPLNEMLPISNWLHRPHHRRIPLLLTFYMSDRYARIAILYEGDAAHVTMRRMRGDPCCTD